MKLLPVSSSAVVLPERPASALAQSRPATAAPAAPCPAELAPASRPVWAHVRRRTVATPRAGDTLAGRVADMYDRYAHPTAAASRLSVLA